MIADFFTKPLQGALFHLFRKVIMGSWAHINTVYSAYVVPKERVGNNKNGTNGIKDKHIKTDLVTSSHAADKKKSYAEAIKLQNEEVKERSNTAYESNEDEDLIKLK